MKKLLVVGIIILLVGMSGPSTGINVEKSSTALHDGNTLYVDDDCDCAKKASKSQFLLLKMQKNKLKKFERILPLFSKENPEIEKKYNELSDIISTILHIEDEKLKSNYWDWPFPIFSRFCEKVENYNLEGHMDEILKNFPDNDIFWWYFFIFFYIPTLVIITFFEILCFGFPGPP